MQDDILAGFPRIQRVESISTNATADDLPGPGRSLGKLYDHGGRKLERAIGRIAKWRARRGEGVPVGDDDAFDDDGNYQVLPAGVVTHEQTFPDASSYPLPDLAAPLHRAYTFSTNATAGGLPGPGRGLDQLYQLGGRRLERAMNLMAMRAGLGPENAEKRVRKALERVELRRDEGKPERKERWVWSWMSIDGEARAKRDVNRGCKRLVEYTSSPVTSTQLRALTGVITLTSHHPNVHTYFSKHQAKMKILSAVQELLYERQSSYFFDTEIDGSDETDVLLATSRKALFCVEDNELNGLAKRLLWDPKWSNRDEPLLILWRSEWEVKQSVFFSYLSHPDLSFLALRYLSKSFLPFLASSGIHRAILRTANLFTHLYSQIDMLTHALTGMVKQSVPGSALIFTKAHGLSNILIEPSELIHAIEVVLFVGLYVTVARRDPALELLWTTYVHALDTLEKYPNRNIALNRRLIKHADLRAYGKDEAVLLGFGWNQVMQNGIGKMRVESADKFGVATDAHN